MLELLYGAIIGACLTLMFMSCIAINYPDNWKEEKHGKNKNNT